MTKRVCAPDASAAPSSAREVTPSFGNDLQLLSGQLVACLRYPAPEHVQASRRGGAHSEVLVDTGDSALDEPNVSGRGSELRIGNELRLDQLDHLAACLDRAGAGGENVPYPLHVRSVGQVEEIVIASPEHVDRRPIGPSTLASPMRQHCEARKPRRERPCDRVDVAVHERPQAPHAGPAERLDLVAHVPRRYERAPGADISALLRAVLSRHGQRALSQSSSPCDHGTALSRVKTRSSASLPDQTPIFALSG